MVLRTVIRPIFISCDPSLPDGVICGLVFGVMAKFVLVFHGVYITLCHFSLLL